MLERNPESYMWDVVRQNLNEIGVLVTALTFLLSIAALSFSAYRYVTVRRDELRNQRYEQYHTLLMKISRGIDEQGGMKLVSQRAFIYELRHFPEYGALTKRLLESLLDDWKDDRAKNEILSSEIRETISALK
jgi:hypothetical protein